MANYYMDCEFHEGFDKPLFGKCRHFIDLISIGIVSDDGREYYAISKDFDIKAAWNSFQMKQVYGDSRNIFPEGIKEYWLRDNVLKPLFYDIWHQYYNRLSSVPISNDFTYKNFKNIIKSFGKSNNQISEEILKFVNNEPVKVVTHSTHAELSIEAKKIIRQGYVEPVFYAYYADYDWVVFCSLFGKMTNLPKGFPMYCKDLKQTLDETAYNQRFPTGNMPNLKYHFGYPIQKNEHNALSDAKWNLELHKFLNTINII